MICPHASPVPFTSIWKPYSTIRPITGIATRSWGLLRSSRSHPPGMPEAWLERGDTVRPVHRGIRLVSTLSVFHRRVAGIPPQDTSTTGRWYREYQPLVALVPRSGTRRTLVRYFSYQTVVRTVPSKEIYWYMHTTDRQQSTQYEFTNIFSLSLFPVSAGLYKTET